MTLDSVLDRESTQLGGWTLRAPWLSDLKLRTARRLCDSPSTLTHATQNEDECSRRLSNSRLRNTSLRTSQASSTSPSSRGMDGTEASSASLLPRSQSESTGHAWSYRSKETKDMALHAASRPIIC